MGLFMDLMMMVLAGMVVDKLVASSMEGVVIS